MIDATKYVKVFFAGLAVAIAGAIYKGTRK